MKKPRICASVVNNEPELIKNIEPLVDLFEARIDLIGDDWPQLVRHFNKPWIACNRSAGEGGRWSGNETERVEKLLQAIELGAGIVDIESGAADLDNIVEQVRKRAKCLLSFHDMERTPPIHEMEETVKGQLKAGADICKVVTTARGYEDNLTVLKLISAFPGVRIVSFAMGPSGSLSRVLCPLCGGEFTYASIEKGKEAAEGQITVKDLRATYQLMGEW